LREKGKDKAREEALRTGEKEWKVRQISFIYLFLPGPSSLIRGELVI